MGAAAEFEVWWVPQLPMKEFVVSVPTYEEGALICEVLANYDLFQFENNVKPDYCNTGGVRVRHPEFTDGEWWEVSEDEDERASLFADLARAIGGGNWGGGTVSKFTPEAATAWSDALDAGRPARIRAMRLEIERLRADAKSWREDGDAMHTDSASMTGQAAVDVRRAGISRMQRADEIDAQADALEALQSSEPTS